jgi:hypothetical protein
MRGRTSLLLSSTNPPLPKTSAYSRSRTFRLGVWALAAAAALIAWHAIKDGMVAGNERLFTEEGTVVEHRSTETRGENRVRLRTGGTNTIQGQRQLKTYLRIKKRDGTIAEFSAPEWFPTPKAGWEGQRIRVQHDSLGNLYEIVVAGEVVRDAETTRKYRRIDNKKSDPLMVFLIVAGVPLTLIGYVTSRKGKQTPPPLPSGA